MAGARTGTIYEKLNRDMQHREDLGKALQRLREWCATEHIPIALLGALASAEYGYVRHTEDIDLLTTKEGLDTIHAKLVGKGLVVRGPGLRKSFRDPEFEVKVDVITSGEHAGSEESPVIYPDPASIAFTEKDGLRIPTLASLIGFKLASGQWGHRQRDFGDVQELIKANGLNESFADKLIPELRPRYLALLSESRQERKIE